MKHINKYPGHTHSHQVGICHHSTGNETYQQMPWPLTLTTGWNIDTGGETYQQISWPLTLTTGSNMPP